MTVADLKKILDVVVVEHSESEVEIKVQANFGTDTQTFVVDADECGFNYSDNTFFVCSNEEL